jgi:hypothetical protein
MSTSDQSNELPPNQRLQPTAAGAIMGRRGSSGTAKSVMRPRVPYDLSEHRHRFAVWAAARASQPGFTTVGELRGAIEATDIRSSVSNPEVMQLRISGFEELHRRWCSQICAGLNRRGIANVTYGRAAKLVAVYLKAMVIMGDLVDTPFGRSAHPPIDRLLLQKLANSPQTQPVHKAEWRRLSWTQLTEQEYYQLSAQPPVPIMRETTSRGRLV